MSNARHILLTGATGVVGRELVPRLLREHPNARITLLLRGEGERTAVERFGELRADLADVVGTDSRGPITGNPTVPGRTTGVDREDLDRLDAVAGDVGAPHHGIPASTRRELLGSVTHVIHGAATTRLDEPLEVARRVNLTGTLRALAFAESCRNLELFAHVSTAYVCGDRVGLIRESDLWQGQAFLNAYEESKCQAEIRVHGRARELPIVVFRPSIIVGNSANGRISSFASIYSPLRRVADGSLRQLPCREDASLDLVPVDHVAEAIARLTASDRAVGSTYHLCAGPGRRTPVKLLLQEAIRIAGTPGLGLPRFAPLENDAAVPEGTPARLRIFFDYLHLERNFSVIRAQEHLGVPPGPAPHDFVTPMLEFCRLTDWGRRPIGAEVLS